MICRTALAPRARRIALILMDVDGVLTDGRLIYHDSGREAKVFDARDGAGIRMARSHGLRTGIISGRPSQAALRRATELDMDEVHLQVHDKLEVFRRIVKRRRLADADVCYIGDDLVDLAILETAGLPVAVANAHSEVTRRARFITRAEGGHGAVREVIDAILKAQGRWNMIIDGFRLPADSNRVTRRRVPGERRS